jgi:hypothetical protein
VSGALGVVILVILQRCEDGAGQEVEALSSGIVHKLVALALDNVWLAVLYGQRSVMARWLDVLSSPTDLLLVLLQLLVGGNGRVLIFGGAELEHGRTNYLFWHIGRCGNNISELVEG